MSWHDRSMYNQWRDGDRERPTTNMISNKRGNDLSSSKISAKRQCSLSNSSSDDDGKPIAALLSPLMPQVSSRSNSILFAKFAELGTDSAARLAAYWSRRLLIFGERSSLPIIQTGDGALSPVEVEILRKQEQWMVLPSDMKGRTVYFVDCASPFGGSEEERRRCLFYLNSAAVQEGRQDEVVVMIALPGDDSITGLSDDVSANIDNFFSSLFLFPLNLHQVHFVAMSEQPDTAAFLEDFKANLGPKIRPKSKVHVAGTRAELAATLEQEGFLKSTLPVQVGGSFGHQNAMEWHRLQAEVESQERPASVSDGTQHSTAKGHTMTEDQERDLETSAVPPGDAANMESIPSFLATEDDQQKDFVRKRNAMYARRKYARRKIEIEVLKRQCIDLQKQKRDLSKEHGRLEDLVRDANHYVAIFDSSQGRDPRLYETLKSPENASTEAAMKAPPRPDDECDASEDQRGAPLRPVPQHSDSLSCLNQPLPLVSADSQQSSDLVLHLIQQVLHEQMLNRSREATVAPRADSSADRALDLASALFQESPDQSLLLRLASLRQDLGAAPPASQASAAPSILQLLTEQQNLLTAAQLLSRSLPSSQTAITEFLLQEVKNQPSSPKRRS